MINERTFTLARAACLRQGAVNQSSHMYLQPLRKLRKAQARPEQRYWHTDKAKAAAHAIKVDRFALCFE